MRSRGERTPLDDAPALDDHEGWLLTAFVECSMARRRGPNGAEPIALSEIAAWLSIRGVDGAEDRKEVAAAVLAADAAVRASAPTGE